MRVTIRYFAESLATIHGTPLVPIKVDVSPSTKIGELKYIACYASDLIEDMMALMISKEVSTEEAALWDFRPRSLTEDRTVSDSAGLIKLFERRKLDESLIVGDLDDTASLGISIDIDWIRRCPVCGHENNISGASRVIGFDNIPDVRASFACSNSKCQEHEARKSLDIRFAGYRTHGLPLITSFCNGASGADISGSKTNPPSSCSLGFPKNPELSKSEYCLCGAINPTDAYYCWNCGKKNRDVQPKPLPAFPYDLEELRRQVMLEGGEKQSETIARSIAFVQELKRRRVIVEVTHCKHCGATNKVDAAICKRCNRKLLTDEPKRKPVKRKKPWWRVW